MQGASLNKLRTIVLVTFVSALIWAFAEGQSLQTRRTRAEIEFPATSASAYVVRVLDDQGWSGTVELQVEGPATSLEGLETVLRAPLSLAPGMAEGVPAESGEHSVDLREVLRNLPLFRARGVTVISAEPQSVRVVIEALTTTQVPIRVEVAPGEIEGTAEAVGRSEVTVRLPTRVAAQLTSESRVIARVRAEDLARLEPGRRAVVPNVRLEPGPELMGVQPLEITPAQVDVQLLVRSKTEVVVLPSVPVDVRIPPDLLDVWTIEIPPEEQSLRDVRVTGPSEIIQRIRNNQQPVTAFIRLTYTDLERGVTSLQAEFTNLPSQLTVEADDREIQFVARRRGASPEGGSPSGL
jgi:YbbR domain-containing protein